MEVPVKPKAARPLSEGRFVVGADGELGTRLTDDERLLIQNSIPRASVPRHQSGNLPVFEAIPDNERTNRRDSQQQQQQQNLPEGQYGIFEEVQL